MILTESKENIDRFNFAFACTRAQKTALTICDEPANN